MYRRRTNSPRDSRIAVKVSSEEKEQLKKLASAAGLSVAAFLVGRALGEEIGQAIRDGLDKKDSS